MLLVLVGGSKHILLGDDLSSDHNSQIRRFIAACYSRFRGSDRLFSVVSPVHTENILLIILTNTYKTWITLLPKYFLLIRHVEQNKLF